MLMDISFYRGKKIFITGHNGFKGAWMCRILADAGADVCGFSLPCLDAGAFRPMKLDRDVTSIEGDVSNTEDVAKALLNFCPDVVIHMAAQPIVRESYKDPIGTYRTNVMGTVNVLDAVRKCDSVISVINVTTDKVYLNLERKEGYREDDVLDGNDPYANSKSCSELVTAAYRRAFFDDIPISACRAGNVIGGGDFAKDRIIPDCVRAAISGKPIILRNPMSVRPYQHVLEPVFSYLLIAAKQSKDHDLGGNYNIGPDDESEVTTQRLAELFCDNWEGAEWRARKEEGAFHESGTLRLNCAKFRKTFGLDPVWDISEAVRRTVDWYRAHHEGNDMKEFTAMQIREFLSK